MKSIDRKLVSICIPVLDEVDNIDRLIKRLQDVCDKLSEYRFEFVFTDNCSSDGTFEALSTLAETDHRIRVLRFSRNFGFQKSILTNFLSARGDCAIQIDADLQDPPEMFADFLAKWEEGYSVVYGIRTARQEGKAEQAFRKFGYRVIRSLSEVNVPSDAGDFRLIDRKIIEHLRTIEDQAPYLRGLIAGLGYKQTGIQYARDARIAGESKFKPLKLIGLGVDGLTSQSIRPLRVITFIGVLFALTSLVLVAFYLISYILGIASEVRGFTTLSILILLSASVQAISIGVVGEYVGRIFNNSRRLPITIVDQVIDHVGVSDMDANTKSKRTTKS